jgi:hypothetical protein
MNRVTVLSFKAATDIPAFAPVSVAPADGSDYCVAKAAEKEFVIGINDNIQRKAGEHCDITVFGIAPIINGGTAALAEGQAVVVNAAGNVVASGTSDDYSFGVVVRGSAPDSTAMVYVNR